MSLATDLYDGQGGQDDLIHAAEVLIPHHLGLLPPAEHLTGQTAIRLAVTALDQADL